MALSIDPNGSAVGFFQQGAGTSATITISTTNPNDFIILDFTDSVLFSTAVPTSANLTWSQHVHVDAGSSSIMRFTAVAASPLTNEVIMIGTLGNGFTRGTCVAISGANTTSPFDAGGPVISTTGPDPLSITTVNMNTMLVAYYPCNTPTSPGAGFTTIHSAAGDFALSEYQILSAAGTTSVTIGAGGNGTASSGIIDGIVAAAAAAPAALGIRGLASSEY